MERVQHERRVPFLAKIEPIGLAQFGSLEVVVRSSTHATKGACRSEAPKPNQGEIQIQATKTAFALWNSQDPRSARTESMRMQRRH